MKKKLILLILAAAVLLTGCKSLFTREGNLLSDAKRAEKNGDYYTAVMNTIEAVKIDTSYKKAIEFLKEVYPDAQGIYALKIEQTRSAGGASMNDDLALYYRHLYDMNEAARNLPPVLDPVNKMQLTLLYTDYSKELKAANEAAAEDHYQAGLKFLALDGRENAKAAVAEFEKTLDYSPGYKDAEAKINTALDQATQIVAFFPFVNNAWNIPTAQFADIMENSTISELMADAQVMKYTRIIDKGMQQRIMEEQAGSLSALMDEDSRVEIGELLNANIIVTGTIDSAYLDGPTTSMSQYHRTADIEIDETEAQTETTSGFYKDSQTTTLDSASTETSGFYKDNTSSDVTVYGTYEVEADVFVYRKSITFEVTLSYKAIDVESGAILKTDTLHIPYEDYCEWAEWSGNEEALTYDDKLLIDLYEESVMSAQQLAVSAAEEAGVEIAAGLASFLK